MRESAKMNVSAVIPAYNAEKTLEAAVRSVLTQTVSVSELIVVDDGSKDGTWALMEKLAAEDPRVRIFRQDNSGVSAARNSGVSYAKSEWIAFLDSDDLWLPEKLEAQFRVLADDPDTDMVYTGYGYINADGSPRRYRFRVPAATSYRRMLKKNVMSTSGILLRRSLLSEHPFLCNVAHEDLYEWLTLLRAGAKARGVRAAMHLVRLSGKSSRSGDKRVAAGNRMKLYEQMGLSRLSSLWNWLFYAVNAGWKYLALRLMG